MAFVFFDPRKIVDVYFTPLTHPDQTLTDSSHWHLHFIAPVWISMLTNYLENHLQREINWGLSCEALAEFSGGKNGSREIAMRKMARDIHAGENSFIHSKFSEVWIKRFTAAKPA